MLQDDAAAGAEEALVEGGKVDRAADAELRTGGFTEAAVGLEGGDDRDRVTRRQRPLVGADDIGLVDRRIGCEQGRADAVVPQEGPLAVVDREPRSGDPTTAARP